MPEKLDPHLVELIYDAALKSFWRKRALGRFLRLSGVADSYLSGWTDDETKRDLLDRLFEALRKDPRGVGVILAMGRVLSQQTSFPDLNGWEDSRAKIAEAAAAVERLRAVVDSRRKTVEEEDARAEARRQYEKVTEDAARSQRNLLALQARLEALAGRLGTQQAGYAFQDWFYDLVDHFEISCRRPYKSAGREIDGSLTLTGTTYLVELKFTRDQAGAPDVDVFRAKVTDKADNTMGLMFSISGFSEIAVGAASGARSPVLLLDHTHLYMILSGVNRLDSMIERVRRHASQTGRSYLAIAELGG